MSLCSLPEQGLQGPRVCLHNIVSVSSVAMCIRLWMLDLLHKTSFGMFFRFIRDLLDLVAPLDFQ